MECEVCNQPITGKRSDSRYCSATCRNKAYQMRTSEKQLSELDEFDLENEIEVPENKPEIPNAAQELRKVEREHFNTILDLKSDYGDKIRALEDIKLKNEFTIERLNDKISELKEKHSIDIAEANTSTTKDTVTAISQMPAIQSVLGAFANNLIPNKNNALNGMEDQFNIQEKQIIDAIRRMQPDAQGNLVQMLYILFAKSNEQQMEIFTTLQAYMMPPEENEDDI